MKANPFGEPTTDEVTVVNHLQTVLLNLDPAVVQQVFSELYDTEVPRFEDWETEEDIAAGEDPDINLDDDAIGDGFLIGLSEQPPIMTQADIKDTNSNRAGGRVDLYSTGPGVFIIEAKTKGSLSRSQLSRYAKSLPGDYSYQTVSWAELARALVDAREQMNEYPRGLTDDFIVFIEEADLAAPQRRVRRSYTADGERGFKKFAIKGGEKLTIQFDWEEGGEPKPSHELNWKQFVDLFEQVDPVVLEDAFVEPGDFNPDQHFDGDDLLGSIAPIDNFGDDVEFKFVYLEDRDRLKLGHRNTNGTVGKPLGNDRQGWTITPGEGTELFVESSKQYPGLNKDVRRALFLDFDREPIEEALW